MQIHTEGIRPDRPPVPAMPDEMRGRPCVFGHIINSKNIDFFRKQHPDMEEWSYDEPKMLIIAASHGPYTPFSATVYDEDGNEAICLNYVDYRRKIPGVRPDRRLPTDIMRQIEKNLGIGPEVQPKWHPCYRT